MKRIVAAFLCIVMGVSLVTAMACTSTRIPPEALQLSSESLQVRQLQTRRFDSSDELFLVTASAQLLQDLGYNLDESETALGVVVGSKDREAYDAGQVAGAILVAVLTGVVVPVDKNQVIRISIVTKPIITDEDIAAREEWEGLQAQLAEAQTEGEGENGGEIAGTNQDTQVTNPGDELAALAEGNATLEAAPGPPPEYSSVAVRVTFQRIVYNTQDKVSRLEFIDEPEIYQEFFDKLSQSVFLEAHEI